MEAYAQDSIPIRYTGNTRQLPEARIHTDLWNNTRPSTRGSYFYSANSVFLLQKLKSPYINFCDPVQQTIDVDMDRKNNVYTNLTDIRLSYSTLAAMRQCLFSHHGFILNLPG